MGSETLPVFVAGLKQTRKAVLSGRASSVVLAENADPAMTESLAALCQEHRIPVRWISTMQALGKACSLSVGAAAAAVLAEQKRF